MAYNPGITNRSGEILAQGIASAAQTRMQGYQNATNSLLKGFSDLSKKQQEEEVKRNETLAKFKSDPSLLAKLGEKGNEDLKAKYDKLVVPVDGFWAKVAGREDTADAELLGKFATGTQEATTRSNQQMLIGFAKQNAEANAAAADRLTATDARDLNRTKLLQTRYGPEASVMNDSSLTPLPPQPTAYNPTNFTTPFNQDPRVPGSLLDQSRMQQGNSNPPPTVAGLLNNNPFIQSSRATPMDMSARNLAQTLPSFDRNNAGDSQVVAAKPKDNSVIANLSRSGVLLTDAVVAHAVLEQAKIDSDNRKLKPEGTTGTFIDGDEQTRTWVVRNGETVDLLTGLPLQSIEADALGNRSARPTKFPGTGANRGGERSLGFPNSGKVGGGGGGGGGIQKRKTMSGIEYSVGNIP